MADKHQEELVSRTAPLWAWNIIDEALADFEGELPDGEYAMPEAVKRKADIARALAAMINASEFFNPDD